MLKKQFICCDISKRIGISVKWPLATAEQAHKLLIERIAVCELYDKPSDNKNTGQ